MQDALVLPVFDGGNVGVRRRQIEALFKQDAYDPLEATFGAEPVSNGTNGH
jgi:nitroalkane oxidase